MAAGGDVEHDAVGEGAELAVGGGTERRTIGPPDGLVELAQHLFARRAGPRGGADRVPGEPGERGRARPGATDIADHDCPVIGAHLEDVVEVTPDLGPLAGSPVPHRQIDARNLRQRTREQTCLQGGGDEALVLSEPTVLECGRNAVRDCLGQREVLLGVHAAALGIDELQRTHHPTAFHERHGNGAP